MSEYCCENFKEYMDRGDIVENKERFYIKMSVRDSYSDLHTFFRKMNYCLFCGEKL